MVEYEGLVNLILFFFFITSIFSVEDANAPNIKLVKLLALIMISIFFKNRAPPKIFRAATWVKVRLQTGFSHLTRQITNNWKNKKIIFFPNYYRIVIFFAWMDGSDPKLIFFIIIISSPFELPVMPDCKSVYGFAKLPSKAPVAPSLTYINLEWK